MDAHVNLKSKDSPFGEVTSGFLRVKGMVFPAELTIRGSGNITIVLDGLGKARGVSVLVDGKITHATSFGGVATIARLRTARPSKPSSAKVSTAPAGTSDNASSSSGDDEEGDDDDNSEDDDEDDNDDDNDDDDDGDDDDEDSNGEEEDEDDDDTDDGTDEDEYNLSDDDLNDSSSDFDQKNRLLPFKVQLLHLGFLSSDAYTSYCLILGHSPTQQDRYERLGLIKWKHKGGWRDSIVKRLTNLPKHEVIII